MLRNTLAAVFAALASAVASAAEKTESIVIYADGMPAAPVKSALVQTITTAEVGSLLHLFVAHPRHEYVGTFEIGPGRTHTRLRNPANRPAWQAAGALFKRGGDNLQPNQPEIPSTVRSVRRTDLPLVVTVYGDLAYQAEAPGGITLAKGHVFRDGSLMKDPQCPLTQGVVDFPSGARIVFIPPQNFGVDHAHRAALVRMHRLWCSLHGAQLMGVRPSVRSYGDPGAAQWSDAPRPQDEGTGIRLATLQQPQVTPRRRTVAKPEAPAQTAEPPQLLGGPGVAAAPPEVEEALERAEANARVIIVAIHWQSPDPNADIDMHFQHTGLEGELCFSNPETAYGRLFRDVRHGGQIESEIDFGKWECAQFDNARLQDLRLWLHTYKAKSSSQVRLVMVAGGQRQEWRVEMPRAPWIRLGGRTEPNGWKRIDLSAP